jgi:hypothetical protein
MEKLWSSLPGIYAEWMFPGLVILIGLLMVIEYYKGRRRKPQSIGEWVARVHGRYKI